MKQKRVVVIGSGNVATHLSKGFAHAGCDICQVYSRTFENASALAQYFTNAKAIDDINAIVRDADLYIISLTDTALPEIVGAMPKLSGIVAHTSGTVPLMALNGVSDKIAVLYPLQTFSKNARVDLSEIPFFVEANTAAALEHATYYAKLLSEKVYEADTAHRKYLHVAGVLSCNFANFMWDCALRILRQGGYDLSVIEPLVKNTMNKAFTHGPHNAQTGPAMRGDVGVMNEHIALLDSDTADIYRHLSNAIMNHHGKDCKL